MRTADAGDSRSRFNASRQQPARWLWCRPMRRRWNNSPRPGVPFQDYMIRRLQPTLPRPVTNWSIDDYCVLFVSVNLTTSGDYANHSTGLNVLSADSTFPFEMKSIVVFFHNAPLHWLQPSFYRSLPSRDIYIYIHPPDQASAKYSNLDLWCSITNDTHGPMTHTHTPLDIYISPPSQG